MTDSVMQHPDDKFLADAHAYLCSASFALRRRINTQVTRDLANGRFTRLLALSERLGALERIADEAGRLVLETTSPAPVPSASRELEQ
jgi:hypothetical protein